MKNKRRISSRKPALKYTYTSAAVFRATCLLLFHIRFVPKQGGGMEIIIYATLQLHFLYKKVIITKKRNIHISNYIKVSEIYEFTDSK